jgi:hypothetical protein
MLFMRDEKQPKNQKQLTRLLQTSGNIWESRTKANITTYSQVVCLDFDDIPLTEINNLVTLINNCRYTFASLYKSK